MTATETGLPSPFFFLNSRNPQTGKKPDHWGKKKKKKLLHSSGAKKCSQGTRENKKETKQHDP